MAGETETVVPMTMEDTINDEDDAPADKTHRNHDAAMEVTPAGTHFIASLKHAPSCNRRMQSRLGGITCPVYRAKREQP